jgi:hypothetical protein
MELIYVICQLAAAEVCEEHRVNVYNQSQLACVLMAPAELAQIARPGWQVARWSCGASGAQAAQRASLTE